MSDKTLEEVLEELKEAEKEFKEKCLKYGIEEKHKRKKPEDTQNPEGEQEVSEGETSSEETQNTSQETEENTSEN